MRDDGAGATRLSPEGPNQRAAFALKNPFVIADPRANRLFQEALNPWIAMTIRSIPIEKRKGGRPACFTYCPCGAMRTIFSQAATYSSL